jgi:hypothetical protein
MISILYFSDLTPSKIRVLNFDWVTRSIGLIFFINQNDIILVKGNKSQRVATEFLAGSCRVNQVNRVTPGFFLPYFFYNLV